MATCSILQKSESSKFSFFAREKIKDSLSKAKSLIRMILFCRFDEVDEDVLLDYLLQISDRIDEIDSAFKEALERRY
jgi:hypothetical protein